MVNNLYTKEDVVNIIMESVMIAKGDEWVPQEDSAFKDYLHSLNLLETWNELYGDI